MDEGGMDFPNMKIEKASFLDMNNTMKIVVETTIREGPEFQQSLFNSMKLLLYRIFGPIYVWAKYESFKAVVSGNIVGTVVVKHVNTFSTHILAIGVHPKFRNRGIGTSLMEFIEEMSKNRCRYLTLAVMENNTNALELYQKLGFRNFQYSQIRFKIENVPSELRSSEKIKLEPIFAEEAWACRDKHLLALVEAVSGGDGSEIVQRLYLGRLKGNAESFRVSTSSKEVGYVSIKRKKDSLPVFLIVDKDLWRTAAELDIVNTVLEHAFRLSSRIEVSTLQAYEESLRCSFKKIGLKYTRIVPRIGLAKRTNAI
jgi:ribosomal protein S18 acetylase RimI-like enzyme